MILHSSTVGVATGIDYNKSDESLHFHTDRPMYHRQQNKCYPQSVRKTAALSDEI